MVLEKVSASFAKKQSRVRQVVHQLQQDQRSLERTMTYEKYVSLVIHTVCVVCCLHIHSHRVPPFVHFCLSFLLSIKTVDHEANGKYPQNVRPKGKRNQTVEAMGSRPRDP